MSSIDGIVNSAYAWGGAGGAPSADASRAPRANATNGPVAQGNFGSVFAQAFQRNLATIFERADASVVDQDADNVGAGGIGAAINDTAAVGAAIEQRRELVDTRLANSVSRLMTVAQKLDAEYPLADLLQPASSGTWDPATFRPRNEREAQAFAQRMAIDMTEAAARLDIVKNELDAARLDAQSAPTASARAKVAQLTGDVARQMEYVTKLARIVDNASSESVSEIGDAALGGETERSVYTDVSTRELANEMRRLGATPDEIELALGAGELALGEEKTAGGDSRLRAITAEMSHNFVLGCIQDIAAREERSSRKFHESLERREQRFEEELEQTRRRSDERSHERERADEAAARQQEEAARSYAAHRMRMEALQAR